LIFVAGLIMTPPFVLVVYRRPEYLEELLTPAVELRDGGLKSDRVALAIRVFESRLSSRKVRNIVSPFTNIDAVSSYDLFEMTAATAGVYRAIPFLARSSNPGALDALACLLRYENAYSRQALRALAERAIRFPTEGREILALVRRLFDSKPRDWLLWHRARAQVDPRERVRDYRRLFAPILRFGSMLAIVYFIQVLVALIVSLVALPFVLSDYKIGLSEFATRLNDPDFLGALKDSLVHILSFILPVLFFLVIWLDSRRIGPKQIKGYFGIDAWYPWQLSCLVLLHSFLGLGLYLSIRESIKRNAGTFNIAELDSHLGTRLSKSGPCGEVADCGRPNPSPAA
jgi:hypothetical protein